MANKYGFTEEQLAERRKNVDSLGGESGGGGSGLYVENWHAEDNGRGEMDAILHAGFSIREYHRHVYRDVVELAAKDDRPAKRISVMRYFRCWQSEKWHRDLRFDKEQPEPPTCPMERLTNWLVDHDMTDDEPIFRFGEGCVDIKTNKPAMIDEFSGRGICNLIGGAHGWRKSMMAGQKRLMILVPLAYNGKPVTEVAQRIAIETWILGQKFLEEIAEARKRFGDDAADPVYGPAVYRFVNDKTKGKFGRDSYKVSFLNEMTADQLPDGAAEAWHVDPSPAIMEEIQSILALGDARKLVAALQLSLAADLDLEQIMGAQVKPADDGTGRAKPKPAAAPKAGRRVVVAQPAPPAEPAEPCEGCGTPWPADLRYCPGRATKRCNLMDQNIPEPLAQFNETAVDGDLPF